MHLPPIDQSTDLASRQERLDLLKQIVAFTEANVRAYDVKSQIALAAFVLTANPIVGMATFGCTQAGAKSVLMLLLPAFLVTILVYLWVLWPVVPPASLRSGSAAQDLFFIKTPENFVSGEFERRLEKMAPFAELTHEALKLAYIRNVKARRFKAALISTIVACLAIAAAFFTVDRCF